MEVIVHWQTKRAYLGNGTWPALSYLRVSFQVPQVLAQCRLRLYLNRSIVAALPITRSFVCSFVRLSVCSFEPVLSLEKKRKGRKYEI